MTMTFTALQVQIRDLLTPAAGLVNIISTRSRRICQATWVHVLDGVLWPSDSVDVATLPSVGAAAPMQAPPAWYAAILLHM